MPISGVLIDVVDSATPDVCQALEAIEAIEVHDVRPDLIVAVTDTRDMAEDLAVLEQVQRIRRVAGVNVVFCNAEDCIDEVRS